MHHGCLGKVDGEEEDEEIQRREGWGGRGGVLVI